MQFIKKSGLLISFCLTLVGTLAVISFWELSFFFIMYLGEFLPAEDVSLSLQGLILLISVALAATYFAEKFSVRKLLKFVIPFLFIWGIVAFIGAKYFATNLYFLRVSIIAIISLVVIHLKKLWLIDSELTEKMFGLASESHVLEGSSADVRIETGLKLLETVLPLSESIVFRLEKDGSLNPVARARQENSKETLIGRQNAWRESVALCESALKSRQTTIETEKDRGKSVQIAVPMIYDGVAVGVLCVKILQNFEREDQYLIESFCKQLARNFQRKELRSKDLPNKHWWWFLSTSSAESRVGTTSLIKSLMKEQSFSAVASSYLQEAHAIAYLDGTLSYLNRQMRHLIKFNSNKIQELDLFALLENFKTDVFAEPHLAIRRVLQTGETYRNELFFVNNNKTLDLQISLVKVPLDDVSIHETNVAVKPACFLITLRDISAVKENEKLRSDMASLMSHELRTPVTSIKGFAELLLMDESLSEENREFLTIIANESQRLSKMLSTFLSVSNLEQSDKKEVTKVAVKLDSIVHDVVDEMQENAKRKRIRLVEQKTVNLPPIAADKGLLRRAITNLVDNAIKYSPERTSVIISTILEADFLRVVVEDRGYGVPSDEKEKIWQKFYRVARDGQDKEDGSTGLGLALVKEVAEQHGGSYNVESEVGQGSKFSFTLPRL